LGGHRRRVGIKRKKKRKKQSWGERTTDNGLTITNQSWGYDIRDGGRNDDGRTQHGKNELNRLREKKAGHIRERTSNPGYITTFLFGVSRRVYCCGRGRRGREFTGGFQLAQNGKGRKSLEGDM